ncbi:MAG TPA: LysR family transcriptional regulator [bacterium]|nr:LysR family transcriptional regulator [bacterium]
MNSLGDIALFIKVVESKSFTAAAPELGMTPSAVSKRISRLEDRLGAQLLNRTTRRIGLTEEGAAFYERTARIMTEVEEAESAVSSLRKGPRGLLRVSVPVILGQMHFAPAVPGFLRQYPDLQLELIFNDRYVDLIEEGMDLAVRIDRLPDSSLVARRLAPNRRVVCGSPAYFEQHGVPATPHDLVHHNCLTYAAQYPHKEWFFDTGKGRHAVQVKGNFQTNNAEALRAAALGGLGLALLPTFIVGADLQKGLLLPVLQRHVSSDTAIFAVYPQHRHQSPKVRAFVDYMTAHLGPHPSWDRFAQAQPAA